MSTSSEARCDRLGTWSYKQQSVSTVNSKQASIQKDQHEPGTAATEKDAAAVPAPRHFCLALEARCSLEVRAGVWFGDGPTRR